MVLSIGPTLGPNTRGQPLTLGQKWPVKL